MYLPCVQGVRKAKGFDSIALGADGTGLVMGTGAGIQGCGQKGLEHGRRQTSGCDRAAGLGWAEKGGCCI